ncbi:SLAM family member 5-like [Sceloporus undulatus]|uniref:SLAM family member 5-like n=1 Tax=Sceloporus undulatus TaxID=8520 RepID=UPI001C4C86FA|nr:SLAM family member 5-like [Sceloporus undulatus]
MESPGPLPFSFFFSFFFLIIHAASAVSPTKNFTREAGSAVHLDSGIPKGASFFSIFLRSASFRRTLAIWIPGKPLNVLSSEYSGRITFEEDSHEFRIHNLTLHDGGIYEILMKKDEEVEESLRKYAVFVFNISVTASHLANHSCSLGLLCEAGTGNKWVTYTWKGTDTGVTVSQDAWLRLMDPKDEGDSYTCTAQAPGTQTAWSVTPYKYCGAFSGADGRLRLGLRTFSLFAFPLSLLVLL